MTSRGAVPLSEVQVHRVTVMAVKLEGTQLVETLAPKMEGRIPETQVVVLQSAISRHRIQVVGLLPVDLPVYPAHLCQLHRVPLAPLLARRPNPRHHLHLHSHFHKVSPSAFHSLLVLVVNPLASPIALDSATPLALQIVSASAILLVTALVLATHSVFQIVLGLVIPSVIPIVLDSVILPWALSPSRSRRGSLFAAMEL